MVFVRFFFVECMNEPARVCFFLHFFLARLFICSFFLPFVRSFVSRCSSNKTEQQMAFALSECAKCILANVQSLHSLTEKRLYPRSYELSLTLSHNTVTDKDADPTEWNCQDGFRCIRVFSLSHHFTLIQIFFSFSLSLSHTHKHKCPKNVANAFAQQESDKGKIHKTIFR